MAKYILPSNPGMDSLVDLKVNIPFAHPGEELCLQLLKPFFSSGGKGFPLILFIQGSGWTKPWQFEQLPQFVQWAQKGYVVASVTHRSCYTAPAPAFLIDVKSALRFLRAHAKEYDINKEKVCVFGTSSGGNTALLMGLTQNDPAYEEGDYLDESTCVNCVVDCFGPADMLALADNVLQKGPIGPDHLIYKLGGGECYREVAAQISPINYVTSGKKLPPFLILHGDADVLVPYEDSEIFYNKLIEAGYEADLVQVRNAPHEGSFWSLPLLNMIFAFIEKHLK